MEQEFKVGDRVKCWYHGKWWPGIIMVIRPKPIKLPKYAFEVGIKSLGYKILTEDDRYITYEDPHQEIMEIRTDEKVEDDPDAIFGGFGLIGPVDGPFTIFENDPEPDTSDFIFRNR